MNVNKYLPVCVCVCMRVCVCVCMRARTHLCVCVCECWQDCKEKLVLLRLIRYGLGAGASQGHGSFKEVSLPYKEVSQ